MADTWFRSYSQCTRIKGYSVGTSGTRKQMEYCWIIAHER
jgi:hypothetical protein